MILRTFGKFAVLFLTLLPLGLQSPAQKPPKSLTDTPFIRPNPKTAKKFVELGNKSESAGNLRDALTAYDQAARYAPDDPAVIAHAAILRSRLVREHVEAAERAALAGHMDVATDELGAAMHIDPTNAIFAERLAQLKSMAEEPPEAPDAQPSDFPKLQPQPGKRNIDLRGDTRTVYEQLALLFGVKATFDPDLPSRSVRLRLGQEEFHHAISILGTETGTFWVPVKPNVFLVAQDNTEKRKLYVIESRQTFPLSSIISTEDMTELLRVLRDLTGSTHIELDSRSRTITVRDTQEKLTLIGKIIHELERARGEVLLDIELLEVDANKARQLGITLPTSTKLVPLSSSDLRGLKASTDVSNLLTNLGQLLSAKGIASAASVFPFGGGLSTFLLTLPGTAADFSDTLSLVHSGRQILLRAQHAKPATFFVGDRFPITLSLLSTSTGTVGNSGSTAANFGSLAAFAGTTFPQTSFNLGKNPSALAANHFTGGTLPDIAVASQADNTLSIFKNQDSGNFVLLSTSPIALPANETAPVALASAIFRTDTKKFTTAQAPDLVVVNSASNNISILLGNTDPTTNVPNGTFTQAPGSPIAVGPSPRSIVIADFNGDGFLDLAIANQGDNSITLLRGNGDGTFTPFPSSTFHLTNSATVSETGPVAMLAANFQNKTTGPNGSVPELDLAVVNLTSNNIAILATTVSADTNLNVTLSEVTGSPIAVGNSPVAIATADLNADGVLDLAVVNQADSTVSILLGSTNLDATFSPASGSPLPTGSTPAGIAIASFASGASPDLAVTNEGVNTLGVYIGLGNGNFASRIELGVPAGTGKVITLATPVANIFVADPKVAEVRPASPTALITSVLSSSGLPDVALVAQGSSGGNGILSIILDSSSFSSNNGTNSSQQIPYPASEYVDIGVKIKATPTLHPNHEVTLQLEFEIRSLSGTNINGIPIISNRTLTQTVRVKEDEPTLLGGLTDREETRTITGLPGFANLPVAGYLFGKHSKSLADTELLIVITPRRLRFPDHNTHTIYAGRGGDTGPRVGSIGPAPSERPNLPPNPPPTVQPEPTPAPQPTPPQNPPPNPTPPPNPPPNPNR